jgi:hypothetical protein
MMAMNHADCTYIFDSCPVIYSLQTRSSLENTFDLSKILGVSERSTPSNYIRTVINYIQNTVIEVYSTYRSENTVNALKDVQLPLFKFYFAAFLQMYRS